MCLSQESVDEPKWRASSQPIASKTIDHGLPQVIVTADASHIGWGAVVETIQTQGLWSARENETNINVLELLATKFGMTSLLHNSHGQHIQIQSDNTTAVAYINDMGGL